MTAQAIDKIVNKLKDLPDNKMPSILDYVNFLKKQRNKKRKFNIEIPNQETLKVFKDTDEGKNLNHYDNINDFFEKMKK